MNTGYIPNYTELVQLDDNHRALFDVKRYERLISSFEAADGIFAGVWDWLEKNDFTPTQETIFGVLENSEYLKQKMVEETVSACKKAKLPKFVTRVNVEAAEKAFADLDFEPINQYRATLLRIRQEIGIDFTATNTYFDKKGLHVQRTAVEPTFKAAALRTVSDKEEDFLKAIREAARTLRPFFDMGFPVLETLKHYNYLAPDSFQFFEDDFRLANFVLRNEKQSRAYIRMMNYDKYLLLGGKDTPEEIRVRGGQVEE